MVLAAAVAFSGCGRLSFDPALGDDGGTGSDFESLGTFTQSALPGGGYAVLVVPAPSASTRAYGVISGRLFRSSDSGTSWTECDHFKGYVMSVAVSPIDADEVYVGAYESFLHSTDGCATLTKLADTHPIAAVAMDQNDVFVGISEDDGSGSVQRYAGDGFQVLDTTVAGVTRMTLRGSTIFATSYTTGIRRSLDRGQTWATVNTGLSVNRVTGISYFGSDDELIVQTDAGTYRTADRGATWSAVANGGDGRHAVAVDPGDENFVLAATWHGLFRSTVGTGQLDTTDYRTTNINLAPIVGLAFDPAGSGQSYAATGRGIFSAADHALDWQNRTANVQGWAPAHLVRSQSGAIYAPTSAGMARSFDDGDSWELLVQGMENGNSDLGAVATTGADEVWTAGAGRVLKSTDDADTFSYNRALDIDEGFQAGAITIDPPHITIGTGYHLLSSDDMGNTWTTATLDNAGDDFYDLSRGPDLWAAAASGLYVSTDGGQAFNTVDTGLPGTTAFYAVEALADGTVLAASDAGLRVRETNVWRSGGFDGDPIAEVIVVGTRWYVCAYELGVYYSDDRGATWTEMPGLAKRRPISLVIDGKNRLMVGTDGYGIFRAPQP
jgi:photosystem II stability/assembly factor-like uncharacterized protein